jgi:type I restriction enzyme S subunit
MSTKFVRFGDLFLEPQRNGLTRPKKVRGVGFPMVNMGELFAHSRIKNLEMDLVPVNEEKEKQFFLKEGDLLFARQSLVLSGAGQCSIFLGNEKSTVFESHLIRCRLDQKRFNPNFYFYFFRSPEGRIAIEAIVEQGAGASGIRGSDLVNVQVPTPSKSYQDEVAGLLAEIDDCIILLRETNATLESIAQALFKSWFVDFDPVRSKAAGLEPEGMDAATAALFPDGFEESELGLVPRGWRVGHLSNELRIAYGKNLSTTNLLSEGFPVFGGNGQIGFFSEYLYESRQLLVACRGAASGKINQSSPKSFVTNNSLILEKTKNLPFSYLKGFMMNSDLSSYVTGSAQPQVTIDNLKTFKILVPVESIVTCFESFARLTEDQSEQNNSRAKTLTQLRDTLLPRLVSGQLRLPEAKTLLKEVCA